MLRVLRQPKWLAALLTLPFLMGLCVVAANWQYERHERRSAQEQRVATAQVSAAVPLSSVLAPARPLRDDQRFTSVTVTGQYDPQSVLIRNRPLDETPGLWVVTPCEWPTARRSWFYAVGWKQPGTTRRRQRLHLPGRTGDSDRSAAIL